MIVVRRIAGESFDLVTGEEIPKSLVLTNGHSEVSIPVDDASVARVIELMATSPSPESGGEPVSAPHLPLADSSQLPLTAGATNPVLQVAPEPADDRTPGEYDDPESGVASI